MPLHSTTIVVYRSIARLWQETGLPPSVREIGLASNLCHVGVVPHLEKLERDGYIARTPKKMRSIRILKPLPDTTPRP
jgi:SOS-response transcriptional repressor LexA